MTVSTSPAARVRRLSSLTLALVVPLVLGGCSASASGDGTAPSAQVPTAEAPPTQSPAPEPAENDTPAATNDELGSDEPAVEEPSAEDPAEAPRTQAESCEWDTAGSVGGSFAAPSSQEGDLDAIIIGVWQHTHYDSGTGYKALDTEDIRYVFPSRDRMLYCQHVPGITEYAENAADIGWEDTGIVLPNGSVGYTVTSWDDNTMVWNNHLDGSSYLLQRLQ